MNPLAMMFCVFIFSTLTLWRTHSLWRFVFFSTMTSNSNQMVTNPLTVMFCFSVQWRRTATRWWRTHSLWCFVFLYSVPWRRTVTRWWPTHSLWCSLSTVTAPSTAAWCWAWVPCSRSSPCAVPRPSCGTRYRRERTNATTSCAAHRSTTSCVHRLAFPWCPAHRISR